MVPCVLLILKILFAWAYLSGAFTFVFANRFTVAAWIVSPLWLPFLALVVLVKALRAWRAALAQGEAV
jgi:hypothetical protein